MKLTFALVVGILNTKAISKLRELNALRNKCTHNWLLNVPVRRGRRPTQIKPPLLTFRGRDLHKVYVLKDFSNEYGAIYSRMLSKYIS
jgi:hypothetical protein